jgi:two-component system response regulator AtoC
MLVPKENRINLGIDCPGELHCILLAGREPITIASPPGYLREAKDKAKRTPNGAEGDPRSLAEVEKSCIVSVYESTGRNKAQTAKQLQIGLSTLRRKLESYRIE